MSCLCKSERERLKYVTTKPDSTTIATRRSSHPWLYHAAFVGPKWESPDPKQTGLYTAIMEFDLKMVKYSLKRGANVNKKDPNDEGKTAKHKAVVIATMNENDPNDQGKTERYNASIRILNAVYIVESLSDCTHPKDNCGNTPMHIAGNAKNFNVIRWLLTKNGSLLDTNDKGDIPIPLQVLLSIALQKYDVFVINKVIMAIKLLVANRSFITLAEGMTSPQCMLNTAIENDDPSVQLNNQ